VAVFIPSLYIGNRSLYYCITAGIGESNLRDRGKAEKRKNKEGS
jgi:hypothetical protein